MSIITSPQGKEVKFLGLSDTLRQNILKAILGNINGQITINSTNSCWLGLSSTNPNTSISEPSDPNYRRIKLGQSNNNPWSDFLTITGTHAVNSGIKNEIKFNRSTEAWSNQYPYFFLSTSSTADSMMAYGLLNTPVSVTAVDVVPLFEENKFNLYFPAPDEIENIVNNQTIAD